MGKMHFVLGGVLAIALIGGGALFGDDPKPKGGKLPPNWSKLGLSDEQKRQVYSIQDDYGSKIKELQAQIDDLRKKERAELSKVLTDGQKTRLKEIIASKAGIDDGPKPKNSKPGKDNDK